jgi:hypothetical protein
VIQFILTDFACTRKLCDEKIIRSFLFRISSLNENNNEVMLNAIINSCTRHNEVHVSYIAIERFKAHSIYCHTTMLWLWKDNEDKDLHNSLLQFKGIAKNSETLSFTHSFIHYSTQSVNPKWWRRELSFFALIKSPHNNEMMAAQSNVIWASFLLDRGNFHSLHF